MDLDKIAQNLYKRHEGRYLLYEMEGRRLTFRHGGRQRTMLVSQAKRDVFDRKIRIYDEAGKPYEFREPTYIAKEKDGGFSFNYVYSQDAQKYGDPSSFEESEQERKQVLFKPATETKKPCRKKK